VSYRAPGAYRWAWLQVLLICGIFAIVQTVSTAYLARPRGAATAEGSESAPPREPTPRIAPESTLAPPARSPEAESHAPGDDPAVEQFDTTMVRRVQQLARERGIDPETLLPDAALRERAIASGSLKSDASQELVDAYAAILSRLSEPTAEP
jgi:hypothetical protein